VEIGPLEVIIFSLIFWLALYLIDKRWPLKRYGWETGPMYIIRRTQRLNDFLRRTAGRHPVFWRRIWNLGIIVALGQLIFAGYTLVSNLFRFLSTPATAQPVFLLIPGVTISLAWFPYLLVAIGLTLVFHEIAHGIAACGENVEIKSAGIVVAFITFGGFVEPDEEQFLKLKTSSRLRVISSGSFTNLTAAVVMLLLVTAIVLPSSGVLVQGIKENGAAYEAGLRQWDVVYAVNGTRVNDVLDLSEFLSRLKPGETVILNTSRGFLSVLAEPSSKNSSLGSLGVDWFNYYPLRFGGGAYLSYHLNMLFNWILLVLINVSTFNMLPLYPLDGDAYIWSIVERRSEKAAKIVRIVLSVVCLSILASNVGLTFMKYGFTFM